MPKYRVLVQPTGCINGTYWPEAGATINLPAVVGDSMVEAKSLERVETARASKVETRPAKSDVETRKA